MLRQQVIFSLIISYIFLIPICSNAQLGVKLGKERSGPAPTIAFASSDGTSFLAMGGTLAVKGTLELNVGITYPIGSNRSSGLTTVSGGASVYLLNNEKLPIAISLDASIQDNESNDALTIIGSTFYVGSRESLLLSFSPLYILRDRLDKKTGLTIGLHIMGSNLIISPFYTFLPQRSFNNSVGISAGYILKKRKRVD